MLIVWGFFAYKKLAQFTVRCALPPRRSESPVCAIDNKPSCVLHLLGWFIGSRGFSSLEWRPEFWVLQFTPFNHLIFKSLFRWSQSLNNIFSSDWLKIQGSEKDFIVENYNSLWFPSNVPIPFLLLLIWEYSKAENMLFLRIISNLNSTKEKQEASEVKKKKKIHTIWNDSSNFM